MKRLAILFVVLGAACTTGDTSGSRAGTLDLSLTTAGASDGAVVMIVSGGPVTSVSPMNGYQVASNADGSGTHIMVIGPLQSGGLARISVPDTSLAAAYVATVVQVSDRISHGLLDPGRYQVTVAK